jgi:uncharacterized membrane protein
MRILVAYVSALAAFVALDFIWLSVMVQRLYRPELGEILASKPRLPAAVAFYLLYALGLVFLAVAPALKEGAAGRAALNGLVFGAMAYATYDLTNLATLRTWSMKVSIADIAWGACATALAAVAAFAAARAIAR